MWLSVATAFFLGTAPVVTDPRPSPAISFQTSKPLPQLQQCLTDKLAEIGEVVAVTLEEKSVTLVLRDIPDGPMTIDLEPPLVTVTSKPASNTLRLVRGCV